MENDNITFAPYPGYVYRGVDSEYYYQPSCSSVEEWNEMLMKIIIKASVEIEKATRKK